MRVLALALPCTLAVYTGSAVRVAPPAAPGEQTGSCAVYCRQGFTEVVESKPYACRDSVARTACSRERFSSIPRCPYSIQWGAGECSDCFRYDMAYHDQQGSQAAAEAAADAASCQRLCAAADGCAAFAFRPNTSTCLLQRRTNGLVPAVGAVSGLKSCRPPQLALPQVESDTEKTGGHCCVYCKGGEDMEVESEPYTCLENIGSKNCARERFEVLPRCPYVVRWHARWGFPPWLWILIGCLLLCVFGVLLAYISGAFDPEVKNEQEKEATKRLRHDSSSSDES